MPRAPVGLIITVRSSSETPWECPAQTRYMLVKDFQSLKRPQPRQTSNFCREVTVMPGENPLTRENFDFLAKAAGLNANDPHMDELFLYVVSALAGIERLAEIDVAGAEPDMAFNPAQPFQE